MGGIDTNLYNNVEFSSKGSRIPKLGKLSNLRTCSKTRIRTCCAVLNPNSLSQYFK
mgnify:CR=1 FL=1